MSARELDVLLYNITITFGNNNNSLMAVMVAVVIRITLNYDSSANVPQLAACLCFSLFAF